MTAGVALARAAQRARSRAPLRADPDTRVVTRASGVATPYTENALFSIIRGDTPTQYQRTGKTARINGFEQNAVVQACVRLIAAAIAQTPIEVYKKDPTGGRDVIVQKTSPLLNVLERPWYTVSPYRWRNQTAMHYLLYGNAFSQIMRQNDDNPESRPTGLRLIHPERLMYVYLDLESMEPYQFDWRDRNGLRWITPSLSMLHFVDLGSEDWVFGYPRAAAALKDIISDNEASEYTRQVVTNDGTAGTIVMVDDQGMAQDELTAMERRYYEKRVMRGKRGSTQFMSGVKDVKVIGFPLKDLEFPGLRQINREDICAVFGVDPRMIAVGSATKDAGLSGVQFREARLRLVGTTVEPLMHDLESMLDLWLAPEFGDVYCRFSPDGIAALTEDETDTWTRVTAAVQQGTITREEGRRKLGVPDKPNPEDTLYVPRGVSVIPVSMQFVDAQAQMLDLAGKQADVTSKQQQNTAGDARLKQGVAPDGSPLVPPPPTPAAGGTAAPAGPATGEAGEDLTAGEPTSGDREKEATGQQGVVLAGENGPGGAPGSIPTSSTPASDDETGKGKKKDRRIVRNAADRAVLADPDTRRAIWQVADAKATAHESAMHGKAVARFSAERSTVVQIFRRAASRRIVRVSVPNHDLQSALEQVLALYALNKGDLWGDWVDEFSEVIAAVMADVGGQMADALTIPRANLTNPELAQVITQRATRLANYVSTTTANQIEAAVHAGLAGGMGIQDIADLIESTVFGDAITATRATTIARTESIGALNASEHAIAKLSNVVDTKQWLTMQDDRVRESHAEQDGEEVALEEPFTNGLQYPGDPTGDPEEIINCRCVLIYNTGDDSEPASDSGEDD